MSEEPDRCQGAIAFEAGLKRREQAAKGLEKDLLHEVPLLYGSPSQGNADMILARIHREEMLRRHDAGIPKPRAP